jgi:hypothetical protein
MVLGGANLAATAARFVLLRAWIYHPRHDAGPLRLPPRKERIADGNDL